MAKSKDSWRKILVLTIVGGLAFWIVTFAISFLPISSQYRTAELIPNIQTVWVGGFVIGMVMGFIVSYFLLRFSDRIPTKNPISKSVILSLIALVIVLVLVEVPSSFRTSDASHYFQIGVLLNIPRFLAFGIVIGYLYKRLHC